MKKYLKSVKLLFKEEKEGGHFLSVYIPVKHYSKIQLEQKIKSLLLNTFRSYENFTGQSRFQHEIIDKINKEIRILKNLNEGLAIFVKIDLDEKSKQKIDIIHISQLNRAPKKEAHIGEIFDLDQFVWLHTVSAEALMINLNRKKGYIYRLEGNKWNLIQKEKNNFIVKKEKEYLGRVTGTKVCFGSGSQKVKDRKKRENKRFLDSIKKALKKDSQIQNNIDYLIVFYSNEFVGLVDELRGNSESYFPNTNLILVGKNIQKESLLKEKAMERLKEEERKREKELLKKAKSKPGLFIEEWDKVIEAVQMKNVETLFIQPTLKKKGFIRDNLISIKEIKNSRKVKNIAPWTVKNVLESGGKVVVLRTHPEKDIIIGAKIRYNLLLLPR